MRKNAKKLSPSRSHVRAFTKCITTLQLDGNVKSGKLHYERTIQRNDVSHYFDQVGQKLSSAMEKSASK